MPVREYRKKLEQENLRLKLKSISIRDIAPGFPGKPKGPSLNRRRRCESDLRSFLEQYFPNAFKLAWSPDHLKIIAILQGCILNGGLFAMALPRGGGKSTICERAILWAALYRHRRFPCIIGATGRDARKRLKNIKTELEHNALLAADFPEVCYPIRCLENNARRCAGQLFQRKQTLTEWGTESVTFPTMPNAACVGKNASGSTIVAVALTGAIKGRSATLADGTIIRPDFVIPDDPQTRESARSAPQNADRMAIINGDVLGMAGPGQKIACVMPCTVIFEGDMFDRLLDQEEHPEWQGVRGKMLNSLPTNEPLWEQYGKLRGPERNRFYKENRAAMDAGAVASWSLRKNTDELSAIQHAMNLKIDRGDAAFFAEYQNEPITAVSDVRAVTATQVAAKLNGIKRGICPRQAEHLTMFIDVHDDLLFWSITAWSQRFDGWVIDYGAWPEQGRRYFILRKAARTLGQFAPGAGQDGAIRKGIDDLVSAKLSAEYDREDGAKMKIGKCLIDAGYKPDVVFDIARHSIFSGTLKASRGFGVTASMRPMTEYPRKEGEQIGWHWLLTPPDRRSGRYLRFDSNHWKSFVTTRLLTSLGDAGCLSLYGHNSEEHRMIADHLTSEIAIRTQGQGRTLEEWKLRPDKPDNHLLDCTVGCAVGASMLGASLQGVQESRKVRRPYAERYAKWRSAM